MSVVLTTHFLDEAEQLADTVVVIDAGRVVAAGSPAELTRAGARGPDPLPAPRPACRSTTLHRRPARRHPQPTNRGRATTWSAATSTPQLLATLTAWCAREGVLAEHLAVERRSLEDVFLDLTGRELRA